ncbi:MAG: DUF4263 domain-containing protein [Proteobacteria bacterium]|nr:DUF4263 domain-containing protein [Pseudomonadota bacterium]
MKLESGDIVSGYFGEAEVTSINHEGRVYFKGGRGFFAWPDTLTIEERKDSGDTPLRQRVLNDASERKRTEGWSDAKAHDLIKHRVPYFSDVELQNIINTFEDVLNSADDESPLQSYFEEYPMIFGGLLGRESKYVIPRPNLGGKYIPDFLLVDIDSQGAHWTFVELESPTANIYIKGGKAFSLNARIGIDQIKDWRRWIADNRDHARKQRSEGGLGLSDIDDRAKGLVIIGRRDSMIQKGNAIRRQLKNENNISLRTYDGIIQQILSSISFNGSSAVNPYLVRSL